MRRAARPRPGPTTGSQSSAAREVVELALEPIEPAGLVRARELALGRRARARGSARRGAAAARRVVLRRRSVVERVLANRLEHREADARRPSTSLRTRLQPTSASRSREERRAGSAIARASSSDAPSAKTASAPCSSRWLVAQAPVAPVDRRAQRSLALREVDRALHLEREPLAERAQDLRRREDAEARGDELDRERQPVEATADLVHRRERVAPAGSTPRAAASSTKSVVASSIESGSSGSTCSVESRSGARLVASTCEVGGAVEQLGDVRVPPAARCSRLSRKRSAPVPSSVSAIASSSGCARRLAHADRARDRARDELGIGDRARARRGARAARAPPRAATSSARRLLPAPPGPVIVTSRTSGSSRRRLDACERVGAADEPVVERREARRRQRPERREVLAEPGRDELEELDGAGTSFSRWRPSGRNERSGSGLVAGDVARRPRDDDLLAVGRRADPGGDDDVHADVALVAELGLAGVDPDAQAMRLVVRPRLGGERPLDLGRGRDRIARACEREKDPVAGPVDLVRRRCAPRPRARARACARARARTARRASAAAASSPRRLRRGA